jgi:hypothetical protein
MGLEKDVRGRPNRCERSGGISQCGGEERINAMNAMQHLFTLYTRSPLHVGSGTSVDVVDLPIMRERVTGFPVIPATSLKGVLLQRAREVFEDGKHVRSKDIPAAAKILFGNLTSEGEGDEKKQKSNAGCVQIMAHIPHIAGRISAPVLASGYEAAW